MARLLTDVVEEILPYVQPKRRSGFRDDVLSRLRAQSCAARAAWRDPRSSPDGPQFEEKHRLRRAVRKRVRWCAEEQKDRVPREGTDSLQLVTTIDSKRHRGRSQDAPSWWWRM